MPIETVTGTSLDYYLLAFDALGNERSENGSLLSARLLEVATAEPITDIFVISHGWKGDIPEARAQYHRWIGAMAQNLEDIARIGEIRQGFRPLLVGLHWPSLPWGDEDLATGELSFGTAGEAEFAISRSVDTYTQRIADTPAAKRALRVIFEAAEEDIAPARLSAAVRDAYQILDREASLGDEGPAGAPGADREPFDAEAIFTIAEDEPVSFGSGGILSGILAPLRNLSFWRMKDRARRFGQNNGFRLLQNLQLASSESVRFHLVGHSFGSIVVSAIVAGPDGQGSLIRPVNSMTLLQGALSLWSYCSDIPMAPGRPGYFHSIVAGRKVSGPILTTQSEFDYAVGRFYPLGAGVARQVSYAPEAPPKYGAIGAFGARGPGIDTCEMEMLPVSGAYAFEPGKLYNLESSKFICDVSGGASGAHSDIAKPEVTHAVWSAAFAG
jgi:hypothetical protein